MEKELVVKTLDLDEEKRSTRFFSTSQPSSPSSLNKSSSARQSCLCSPTTHPGSFRCRLHRKPPGSGRGLTRSSLSVDSRLYDLQDVSSKLSELGNKPSRLNGQ
ncbi:hypothetical protein NMG60_11003309 [Bertholletia excelsa]